MGTYVTIPTAAQTDASGSYVSASRNRRSRSTGYVSGSVAGTTGAYVCSNLK